MYNRIATTILFLVFGYLSLSAQLDAKKAIIHMDKPYYVSGETMWYQVYLPEVFRGVAGSVQILIEDESGKIIDDAFWNIGEAHIQGYFNIPYDVSTSVYTCSLRALNAKTRKPLKVTSR